MSGLTKIKPPKKARIGLYSAGLNTYWGQFEGLYDCLMGYNRFIEKRLSEWGEVFNFGMVDTEEKGREAGEFSIRIMLILYFHMRQPITQVQQYFRFIRSTTRLLLY